MASIFSKKGVLYLGYYLEDDYGRKKHVQFSLKLKDNRENRKIAKNIKMEKEAELIKPNKKVLQHTLSLEKAFKLFMKVKETTAYSTKKNYRLTYNHLVSLISAKTAVSKIGKTDIQRFELYLRDEIGLSQNSIASYFRHLKSFWNWMVSEKFYSENIVHSIKTKDKPIEIIQDKDFETILKFFEEKNIQQYRIVKFLQLTGLRIGEATELKWEWVNFERKRITMKNIKGKRVEEFPLYPALAEFLISFRRDSGTIFNYKNSDSLKFWTKAMKKLGFNYRMHSIRKTFATKLVEKDISIFDAMKLLRHKNVSTTIKYYTAVDLERLGNKVNTVYGVENTEVHKKEDQKKSINEKEFQIFNIKQSHSLG